MNFTESMVEYMQSVVMGKYEFGGEKEVYDAAETANPGFYGRLSKFEIALDKYKESGDDALLVPLLREEFILHGMVEEARIDKMKKFWETRGDLRRQWMVEDQKERPKLTLP